MIYLDNNATTKVVPAVLSKMEPYWCEAYANPSSLYGPASEVRRAIEEARDQIARCLGLTSSRGIIFTSGGTESNNAAIRSALRIHTNRRRVVTTAVEHSSIRNLCQALGKDGYQITTVGVTRSGKIDLSLLEQALGDDVAIVSVMWVNNETGVLFPIEKIVELTRKRKILLHADAVQAVGKIPIDFSRVPVDYLSASSHKFHGPKGIGFLYVREGVPFHPLVVGGPQERNRRAGTENVSGIIGMAFAMKLAYELLSESDKAIKGLRDRLEDGLLDSIPDSFVNGCEESRVCNTTNMTIPGIDAQTFLIRLGQLGIYASSGSACLTGALEPSHVLMAMGLLRELATGSLRFSLSRYTKSEEIDRVLATVPPLVTELRELRTYKTMSLRGA